MARTILFSLLAGLVCTSTLTADTAVLVDQRTIIDNIPIGSLGPEDSINGSPGYALNSGDGTTSGWIDAAMLSYDFGPIEGVLSAQLTIDVDIVWANAGMSPIIELYTFADNGSIELNNLLLGGGIVRDSFQYESAQMRTIDVTEAVNAALRRSRYVGFRFENSRTPFELPNGAFEGIHFAPIVLDFVPVALAISQEGHEAGALSATGATPNGPVALLFGRSEGSPVVPAGPGAGIELGLDGPVQVLWIGRADGEGRVALPGAPPPGLKGYIQVLDLETRSAGAVFGF
jgi:hypothetical protein